MMRCRSRRSRAGRRVVGKRAWRVRRVGFEVEERMGAVVELGLVGLVGWEERVEMREVRNPLVGRREVDGVGVIGLWELGKDGNGTGRRWRRLSRRFCSGIEILICQY